MCLGKGEMIVIPMHLLGTFLKILTYHAKIALHVIEQNPFLRKHQNRQISVHEYIEKGCPSGTWMS